MKKMSMGEKISEALFACLIESPEEHQRKLFEEIEEFKTKYRRSYNGVRRQPFACHIIDSIEEARLWFADMNGELT